MAGLVVGTVNDKITDVYNNILARNRRLTSTARQKRTGARSTRLERDEEKGYVDEKMWVDVGKEEKEKDGGELEGEGKSRYSPSFLPNRISIDPCDQHCSGIFRAKTLSW